MTRKRWTELVQATYQSWSDHNAPRLGAALAYYTLLSMAPLAVLLVMLCGVVLTEGAARQQMLGQVRAMAGSAGERAVTMLIENARQPGNGLTALIIALVSLLMGASGVFLELRDALNTLWDAPKREGGGFRAIVLQRVFAFGMVLALGILLLASVLLSAALAIAERIFAGVIPTSAAVLAPIANFLLPLVILTALFALVFKFVPNVYIDWKHVWIGGFVTAVLFSIGKALLALYLATVGVGSTYGAAGTLVAFVVWVYYSAQIFFFGAAFTKGSAMTCGPNAENCEEDKSSGKQNLIASGQSA